MKFTQFYAGSTVCTPSRCSLMTGYHTGHSFIRGNRNQPETLGNWPISPETVTVVEVLKTAGYATGGGSGFVVSWPERSVPMPNKATQSKGIRK